jgi:ABC-type transport system involved in multi-copper enzyme maturation permease subunit
VIVAAVGLGELLWTLVVIFFMVMYFMIMFRVIIDIFRRPGSGVSKALWLLFVFAVPLIAMLVYLVKNGNAMTERDVEGMKAVQTAQETYIRDVAGSGGPAQEIAAAKALLDAGALTQDEFDRLKAKALG